jgi:hypothetical protein
MKKRPVLTLVVFSIIGIALFAVSWKPQSGGVLAAQANARLQAFPSSVEVQLQPQPQPETYPAQNQKYLLVEFFAGL